MENSYDRQYSSAGDGAGVFGRGSAGIQGVSSSSSGRGVLGQATNDSGLTFGVQGISDSENSLRAAGVRGDGQRNGVFGQSRAPDGEIGFGTIGFSTSDKGRGIQGDVFSTTGETTGVGAYVNSDQGVGVHGVADSSSGRTYGVEGVNNSDSYKAAGVRGRGADVGVLGEAIGEDDNGTVYGVYAEATNDDQDDDRTNYAIGLLADGNAENGYSYGVYARGDMGVYSIGDCRVEGDLDVFGTKNFVETVETTDGPKEIAYAAVEAGRVMTEATDVARLEDGRAEIDLPTHFGMVTSTEESLSIETTPYSIESAGLAVTERSVERIVVEDLDGTGNYEFSYTVKGIRKGYEDREIVRKPRQDIETEREMLNEERSLCAEIEAERMSREEQSAMHAADWEQLKPPEVPKRPETPEQLTEEL